MQFIDAAKMAATVSMITLSSPLELVKTRLQTTQQLLLSGRINENYKSIKHCFQIISQKQGLRSFWKGNGISILRFYPNESINFYMRKFLQKNLPNSATSNVISAIAGGWTAASILYPFDILRISLTSSTQKQTKFFQMLKNTIRRNGIKYFYKGFTTALTATAIFRGIFNGMYDTIKMDKEGMEKGFAAYISAVTAGFICYPLDSIRRRRIIINSHKNNMNFAQQIYFKEGIKGYYKGCKLILPQSIVGAIILVSFDTKNTKKQSTLF